MTSSSGRVRSCSNARLVSLVRSQATVPYVHNSHNSLVRPDTQARNPSNPSQLGACLSAVWSPPRSTLFLHDEVDLCTVRVDLLPPAQGRKNNRTKKRVGQTDDARGSGGWTSDPIPHRSTGAATGTMTKNMAAKIGKSEGEIARIFRPSGALDHVYTFGFPPARLADQKK